MKKYRIREETITRVDGSREKYYYPEYKFIWLGFIPEWCPLTVYPFTNEGIAYESLEEAKEEIQKNFDKQQRKTKTVTNKYYNICIQESKKSIDVC